MDTNQLMGTLVIAIGGPAGVGAIFYMMIRNLFSKVDKIEPLIQRVANLEGEQLRNSRTSEEVIRISEQLKYLTEEVRRLTELLTRRHDNA